MENAAESGERFGAGPHRSVGTQVAGSGGTLSNLTTYKHMLVRQPCPDGGLRLNWSAQTAPTTNARMRFRATWQSGRDLKIMPDVSTTPHPATQRSGKPAESFSLERRLDGFSLPLAGLILAMFVGLGHGLSVRTGLYLDDYAHYEHLQDGDWSYRSAVDAARLGIVGEVLDLWGRQEAGLRFYRPVAFWIMRAEYTLVHWRPFAMHLFSLAWHFGCCALIGVIVAKFLGRRFWGLVAACLMAIHPGQASTVQWIACQTELMTTFFLLTGVLAYAKHACWPVPWCGINRQVRSRGRIPSRWRNNKKTWRRATRPSRSSRSSATAWPSAAERTLLFFRWCVGLAIG